MIFGVGTGLPVTCRSAVIESAVFGPNSNHNSELVYGLSAAVVPSSAAFAFSLIPIKGATPPTSAVKKSSIWRLTWRSKADAKTASLFSLRSEETGRLSAFAQGIALSVLWRSRDLKPPQQALRQRPGQHSGRPSSAGPTGVVLLSGAAGRLRPDVFHFPGGRATAPHGKGIGAVACVRAMAGRGLYQVRLRVAGAALGAGEHLPSAASAARTVGGGALGRCARDRRRRSVPKPIPYSRPRSTCASFFLRATVPAPIFNSTFNARSWNEPALAVLLHQGNGTQPRPPLVGAFAHHRPKRSVASTPTR
jgi:hypothetical protein